MLTLSPILIWGNIFILVLVLFLRTQGESQETSPYMLWSLHLRIL